MHVQHTLAALKSSMPNSLQHAFQKASAQTGISFDHLVRQAHAESGFNTRAAATTSTARGAFQFIEQTWLNLVKNYGAEAGLGDHAKAMTTTLEGQVRLDDPQQRAKLLALRDDPQLSAFMAAKLATENRAALQRGLGRDVSSAELALAHFLGAGGATKVLQAAATNPQQSAAGLLPAAANSNPRVFYTKDGQPKSVADLKARFERVFGTSSAIASKKQTQSVQLSNLSDYIHAVHAESAATDVLLQDHAPQTSAESFALKYQQPTATEHPEHAGYTAWLADSAFMTLVLTQETTHLLDNDHHSV